MTTASCELRTDTLRRLLTRPTRLWRVPAQLAAALLLSAACATVGRTGMEPAGAPVPDPRINLRPGYLDAGQAAWNLELVANRPRPERFFDPERPGNFSFANSDFAFSGNYLFLGGYNGIQVWDISDPRNPRFRSSIVCPGGQGDPSVYRNLLFMSVEELRGRLDCGAQGVTDTVSTERFRGVRIFDISDIDNPRPVATVQTCRGSHTHTLVSHAADPANVYVYVQGTSRPRPGSELPGCSALRPEQDPNTSLFRIEVIRVPLAAPQDARVVNMPRIFADASGNIAGLWRGGTHGEGTQNTAETNMCHDITAYGAVGYAGGACSGNGILLDIRDVVSPRRVDEVSDPNFAYWHSATFNNDANKVIFTDEWGGGTAPRCRVTDNPKWGANAIYRLQNGKLQPAGFYKLPAPQTATENCVAHNGSLIPVPGRDIMVQAWYQGGISVFDFTDPARPYEIAFFDRGPMSATELLPAGHWSAYWYNGRIYGSEIARGLDVLELRPSAHLSQNEIDAAKLVQWSHFNAQDQQRIVWPARPVVARAYLDQLRRNRGLSGRRASAIASELARAERLSGAERQAALTQLAAQLESDAGGSSDAGRVRALAAAVRAVANAK
jgi:hypothetical protein